MLIAFSSRIHIFSFSSFAYCIQFNFFKFLFPFALDAFSIETQIKFLFLSFLIILFPSFLTCGHFYFPFTLQHLGTDMICQLKKLLSWLQDPFIMQHTEMEPVVELLAVFSLSLSLSVLCDAWTFICLCWLGSNIHVFTFVGICFFNQFTMWDQMDGRSYLVLMSENFITNTIQ